jgi:DNA-binding Xre family transcriptional regulator
MTVINRLKEFCEERGITAYSIQRDTAVSASTIYRLNKNPSLMPSSPTIQAICDYYKVQPTEIIRWVPDDGDNVAA